MNSFKKTTSSQNRDRTLQLSYFLALTQGKNKNVHLFFRFHCNGTLKWPNLIYQKTPHLSEFVIKVNIYNYKNKIFRHFFCLPWVIVHTNTVSLNKISLDFKIYLIDYKKAVSWVVVACFNSSRWACCLWGGMIILSFRLLYTLQQNG